MMLRQKSIRSFRQGAFRRGVSLVEISIVMGVAGIIVGGVWSLAGSMNNTAKQERFAEMLTSIVGNIRGNYAGKAYFETTQVDTANGMMVLLNNMNVFPSDAVHQVGGVSVVDSPFGERSTTGMPSAGKVYNSLYVCGWKGTPASPAHCDFGGGTANVPLFAIEALILGGQSCSGAVLRNSSAATLPGLVGLYINGTSMPMPMTFASIPASCKSATTVNYVDFVFRLLP